ncbi:uncharacterized protein LOC115217645 [Octopus sinensis]|uniref:Uncharacterized protein LOC115217645 n=1 Tax=Octopus sinensis TaxID=2607531 RepID=A0A7E6F6D8_9MOLL|nr:uncharacterized protein LOC115217645 [Octopus sinensis]
MTKLGIIFHQFQQDLTEKEKDYFSRFDCKTSNFCGLPKIHKSEAINKACSKSTSLVLNIPHPRDLKMRPIVAGPSCKIYRLKNFESNGSIKDDQHSGRPTLYNKGEFQAAVMKEIYDNTLTSACQIASQLADHPDFHFVNVISRVESFCTHKELFDIFNDQGVSDYLVVYWRLLASGYLQRHEDFFSNFVEGHRTVKEFCGQEVEPMGKESDHIHITALTSAVGIPVRVEYMDRGEGGSVNHHDFPENSKPTITLLYRPGHYDILY